MNGVYWASFALCWVITVSGWFWMRSWRLKLQAATADMRARLDDRGSDGALAEWARHMSLTVITVTGAVFSTTFAELQASEAPTFRQWNVPTNVTVWSDLADEELTADARLAVATQDGIDG